MSDDALYGELNAVFRELFMDDTIVVTAKTTARSIPHWNSMNHINLLLAIEMHFGIDIMTKEIEGLHNVGDLADLIRRKTARGS